MRWFFAVLSAVIVPILSTTRVRIHALSSYSINALSSAKTESDDLCSLKDRASCNVNWHWNVRGIETERSSECAWIKGNADYDPFKPLNFSGGGVCVPNCRHPSNNNERRCEKNFCIWTGQSCQFAPSNASIRRAFCDDHVPAKSRRMVDKDGNQVRFYDSPLSSKQQLFCQGMLGDGDDAKALEGRTVKDVMLASMMRCWRPRPGNRDAYWDRGAQSEMMSELGEALHGDGRQTAETTYPILMADRTVFYTSVRHTFVGLVNRVRGRQTNFCQEFDYTGTNATSLDEFGCQFFKASFQPLQKLTRCLIAKMDEDPLKKLWDAVAGAVVDSSNRHRNSSIEALYNELVSKFPLAPEESKRLSIDLRKMIEQYKKCPHPACVGYFKEYDRAYEIIKQVEWDSWQGLRAAEVFKLLDSRLKSTLATPVDSDPPALSETTRRSIMTECFEVGDVDAAVSDAAAFLKEALACHPLMSDYQQVPHPPKRALWPRFTPDLGRPEVREAWYKGEGDNRGAHVREEFKNVHPLCARMALSALLPSFSRSEYPFKKFWHMGRDVVLPGLWKTEDNACLTLDTSHCISFTECWKGFLLRHVPSIALVCSADTTA